MAEKKIKTDWQHEILVMLAENRTEHRELQTAINKIDTTLEIIKNDLANMKAASVKSNGRIDKIKESYDAKTLSRKALVLILKFIGFSGVTGILYLVLKGIGILE